MLQKLLLLYTSQLAELFFFSRRHLLTRRGTTSCLVRTQAIRIPIFFYKQRLKRLSFSDDAFQFPHTVQARN